MVWIMNVGMKMAHMCDLCGHGYLDARTAFQCEKHCAEHKSPSRDIIIKAVYLP